MQENNKTKGRITIYGLLLCLILGAAMAVWGINNAGVKKVNETPPTNDNSNTNETHAEGDDNQGTGEKTLSQNDTTDIDAPPGLYDHVSDNDQSDIDTKTSKEAKNTNVREPSARAQSPQPENHTTGNQAETESESELTENRKQAKKIYEISLKTLELLEQ